MQCQYRINVNGSHLYRQPAYNFNKYNVTVNVNSNVSSKPDSKPRKRGRIIKSDSEDDESSFNLSDFTLFPELEY